MSNPSLSPVVARWEDRLRDLLRSGLGWLSLQVHGATFDQHTARVFSSFEEDGT